MSERYHYPQVNISVGHKISSYAWCTEITQFVQEVRPASWHVFATESSVSLYPVEGELPRLKVAFHAPLHVVVETGTRRKPKTTIYKCRNAKEVEQHVIDFIQQTLQTM